MAEPRQPKISMISTLDEITPTTLTDLLITTGVLTRGSVTSITPRENATFNSRIAHLQVVYSPDTAKNAPHTLVLKLNGDHWGKHEVLFYHQAQPIESLISIIPTCFVAEYNEVSGNSLLLLQDYSDTHIAPVTREQSMAGDGIPSDTVMEAIITTIARFHAAWWEHQAMGSIPDLMEVRWWYRDEAFFHRHHTIRQEQATEFFEQFGAEVDTDTTDLIRAMLDAYPTFWDFLEPRVTTYQAMTVTQGDCYLTQFLVPRLALGNSAPAMLVDFQDSSVNFGAYDLVYIMATFWTRTQRVEVHDREATLLYLYWETLGACGVHNYTWQMLCEDYKMMLALMLFDPIQDAVRGSSAAYWQPKLHCLATACQDWGW